MPLRDCPLPLLLTLVSLSLACATSPSPAEAPLQPASGPGWGIVIHGGAGTVDRSKLTPEKEAALRQALEDALRAGHAVLARGGPAVDAVTEVIVRLEDSPLFNAGKGAVFTHDGRNELDASLMDGRTLAAGAVAGVARVKNPILLARRVMERSPHVMMVSTGAEAFAEREGIPLVTPEHFFTQERWDALQEALEKERKAASAAGGQSMNAPPDPREKFGTVGAVALDQQGNLAAGTSTGGMTNKRFGRVGDSPIIGAGTYANALCGVSATGHGEYFIRHAVAHDICARLEYLGVSISEATDAVVMKRLKDAGGQGGVIAMDARGNVALTFNTEGMYRGHMHSDGVPHVALFR